MQTTARVSLSMIGRPTAVATALSLLWISSALVPLEASTAGDSLLSAVVGDGWSTKVVLREAGGGAGDYLAPVHATLSKDGHVMLFAFTQLEEEPLAAVLRTDSVTAVIVADDLSGTLPLELLVQTFPEPREIDEGQQLPVAGSQYIKDRLFCSGHTLLKDGTLFTAGGLRAANNWDDPPVGLFGFYGGVGPPYVARWTWDSGGAPIGSWNLGPHMTGIGEAGVNAFPYKQMSLGPERYYPTATALPDGRILISAGSQVLEMYGTAIPFPLPSPLPGLNLSVEIYDPGPPESFTVLSTHEETPPEIFNGDYTHSFVLPTPVNIGNDSFNVIMIGQTGNPVLMSTSGNQRWSGVGSQRPRRPSGPWATPNMGASTVLLPIRLNEDFGYSNGTILVAGGEEEFRNQIDVYDPRSGGGSWRSWGDGQALLNVDRHHPTTVLLPDGQVAVIAGHGDNPADPSPLLQQVEYVDLRDTGNPFQVRLGSSSSYAVRGYHTVALLLPDGRVLVAGGLEAGVPPNPFRKEKANFEVLSPPYTFQPRPQITSAPVNITYGREFNVTADQALSEAVLISLGSMTHSIDLNQRYVQVSIRSLQPPYSYAFAAPASPQIAPPGYYMLFVLDSQLTPSEATIVQLLPDPLGVPALSRGGPVVLAILLLVGAAGAVRTRAARRP